MSASKFIPELLTVGCWNIEGLFEKINGTKICKMEEQTFQDTIKYFDILCLQETHTGNDEILTKHKDFHAITHCRNKSANNRHFGGFLLLVRNSIRKGIKILNNQDKDIFELILLKKYFCLHADIKLIFAYASPITSCYTKARTENVIDTIERKTLNAGGNCLIMGDLNGRTKLGEDFVRDENDEHSPINSVCYTKDEHAGRANMDRTPIDRQGKKILELCKYSSYRILNGRVKGDKTGKFTRYPSNLRDDPSLIDYALCNTTLMNNIHSFSVLPFTGLSDHCCISVCIRINDCGEKNLLDTPPIAGTECKLQNLNTIYSYNPNKRDTYIQNILCDSSLTKLINIMHNNTEVTSDQIDNSIALLNNILISAAKKTFPTKKAPTVQKKKKKRKGHIWFNNECLKHRRVFRNASKLMSKCPFDKKLRIHFLESRAAYKRICRRAEKDARSSLTRVLIEVGKADPQTFWKIIDKMNKWGKEKDDPSDKISPTIWKKTF